jgi:hypothetical protein
METIRKALKREIHLKLLASMALLLFGELLCIYAFQLNGAIVIVGIVLTVLGIKFTRDALLSRNVEKTPLIQLLEKQPKKIVWVYSVLTQRMPFGLEFSKNATIYFKLIDGDEITLGLPEKKSNKVLKMLNYKLPHATFGYSKDREQWFMASPELLFREEGGMEDGGR